jgi:hypothetical protein
MNAMEAVERSVVERHLARFFVDVDPHHHSLRPETRGRGLIHPVSYSLEGEQLAGLVEIAANTVERAFFVLMVETFDATPSAWRVSVEAIDEYELLPLLENAVVVPERVGILISSEDFAVIGGKPEVVEQYMTRLGGQDAILETMADRERWLRENDMPSAWFDAVIEHVLGDGVLALVHRRM